MAGDVDFRYDRRCVPALARGAAMHMVMIDAAFEAKEFAVSISPDAAPYGVGYIDSFEVDGGRYESFGGFRRATAYLRNTSPHARFVEYGTGQFLGGHRVLTRTAAWMEKS